MAADELIHIYSGSFLNAQFVANVLDENKIKASKRLFFTATPRILSKRIKSKSIDIYGAKNDLYVYHMLQNKLKLDLDKYYKGTFKKDFKDLDKILSKTKFVFDMSAIKGDGGGSQYTFLEAIYQNCILVLNHKWVENTQSLFIHNHNCLVVEDEYDILDIIKNNKINVNKILKNSKKFLKPHLNVKW